MFKIFIINYEKESEVLRVVDNLERNKIKISIKWKQSLTLKD